MNVLVVAAHPDDEVLGAGATIARLVGEGCHVEVVFLTGGEGSRYAAGESAEAERRRVDEAEAAGSVLGIAAMHWLGLPDQGLDALPVVEVVRPIAEVVSSLGPDLVLTHHGGDLNADHRVAHAAVVTATRPVPGCSVRTVLAFEVPSSTEWTFGVGRPFVPTAFYDVTATLDTKLEALASYRGEVRQAPHPRSPEVVRARATTWGSTVGVAAAEAFEVVRDLR